ncbi:MAG TPA: DegV family protein [Acidimicrobiales bacterium]|nr:DegV family protein [Acidimicrobiales bacterium]
MPDGTPAASDETRVAVVADTASALPADLAAREGVILVPMGLSIGGQPVAEADITGAELFRRFGEGITTSGPSPGDYATALEAMGGVGRPVLIVTLAASLSSSHRAATVASDGYPGPVCVLDSGSAAGAEALIALAAARAAAAGGDLTTVEKTAREAAANVRLVGSLSTLEFLVRGGHLPGVAGRAAQRVNLNPVIELRDGKVRPLRPAFSRDAALERILAIWRRARPASGRLHIVAMHGVDSGDAERLLQRVADEAEPATAFLSGFGTTMVAHTGPSLVGLSWWWEAD